MRPKRRLLSTQVQSYQVEWDTNPGVAEVQTVTTSTYLGANELQTIRTFGKDLCGNQPVRRVFLGDDAAVLARSSGEEPRLRADKELRRENAVVVLLRYVYASDVYVRALLEDSFWSG